MVTGVVMLRKLLNSSLRVVWALLFIVFVVLLATLGSLASERGRLFWLHQGLALLPNEAFVVVADDIRWPTLGRLQVGYALITLKRQPLLELTNAELSLSVPALLRQRLNIHHLSARQLTVYALPPSPKKPKPIAPLQLHIPQLPGVKVDRLAVEQLQLRGFTWPKGQGPKTLNVEGSAALNWQQPLQMELTVTEQGHNAPLVWVSGSSQTPTSVNLTGRVQQRAGGWLGQWLGLPSTQVVELGVDVSAQQQGRTIAITLNNATAPLMGQALRAQGQVIVTQATQTLEIPQLQLQVNQQPHTLSGRLSPEAVELKADIQQFDLGLLRLWLPFIDEGKLSAKGQLAWDWDRTHLPQGNWAIDSQLSYNKAPLSLQSKLVLTPGQVDVKQLQVKAGATALSAKGRFNTQGKPHSITFTLTQLQDSLLRQLLPAKIAAYIPAPLNATVVKLGGLLRGTLTKPVLVADLNAEGTYDGTPLRLTGSASTNFKQATFEQLSAQVGEANLRALGVLDWTGNKTQLAGVIHNASPVLAYQHKLPLPAGLTGRLQADWQLQGPLKAPAITVKSAFNGGYEFQREVIPFTVALDASTQIGSLNTLSATITELGIATFGRPVLQLKGRLSAQDNDLRLHVSRLPTQLLQALGYSVGDGRAESRLRLRGSFTEPLLAGYVSYGETFALRNAQGVRRDLPLIWHANISSEEKDLQIDSSFTLDNQSSGQLAVHFPWHNYLQFALEQTGASLPMRGDIKAEMDVAALQLFIDTDQTTVQGRLETDLTLDGTAQAPLLKGEILFKDGYIRQAETGTVLSDIQLYATAEAQRINIVTAFARDGEGGKISAQGHLDWHDFYSPQAIQLILTATNAHIIETPNVKGAINGNIQLTGGMAGMAVTGNLNVAPLEINIDSTPAASIPQLVVREIYDTADKKAKTTSKLPKITLDIIIEVVNRAFIRGRGLTTELAGKVLIKGTVKKPKIAGDFKTHRGQIKLLQKPINLSEGRAQFSNKAFTFLIPATYKTGTTEIKIAVSGSQENIKLDLSSVPELPQEEILSRLLFGDSVENITALQAMSLASSINTLSNGSSFNPLNITRDKLGFDSLRVGQDSEEDGGGVNVGVGKYLNERVYLELERSSNPTQPWQGNLKIDITSDISIESSTAGNGKNSPSLEWRRDY